MEAGQNTPLHRGMGLPLKATERRGAAWLTGLSSECAVERKTVKDFMERQRQGLHVESCFLASLSTRLRMLSVKG